MQFITVPQTIVLCILAGALTLAGSALLGSTGAQEATGIEAIDGDTVEMPNGERVRLLGIDAPEADTNEGPAATAELAELVESGDAELISDPTQDQTDMYGRSLRYLEIDGHDVGASMIHLGYVEPYTFNDNPVSRAGIYEDLYQDAVAP